MPKLPKLPIKRWRTPYYVPVQAMEAVDEFVKRKPTMPTKVSSYKRIATNIGTAVTSPSLFKRSSMTHAQDLVMPSVCRMHVVPKGKKKKLFLMDEMMNDIKSVKKEEVKKSRASTRVKCTPTDSVQPSIKLTIRRKPSNIDSSAEYEIVRK